MPPSSLRLTYPNPLTLVEACYYKLCSSNWLLKAILMQIWECNASTSLLNDGACSTWMHACCVLPLTGAVMCTSIHTCVHPRALVSMHMYMHLLFGFLFGYLCAHMQIYVFFFLGMHVLVSVSVCASPRAGLFILAQAQALPDEGFATPCCVLRMHRVREMMGKSLARVRVEGL